MIGKEILNYRIVSLIGKGGMGEVYLAEHKHIANQKVAIKIIEAGMVNDFTRARLKEEAEHLAALNHGNIVAFHDYHIDEKGNIYLIMEYVDGMSLDKYINEVSGLIVESKLNQLFVPIVDAVGYAHRHGIVHRDIKPANIVINKEGVPKVLDFGIATIVNEEGDGDNMIMGTPSYMSPEQAQGQHLDGRSDIYSLGVMLHHMLTGRPPYDMTQCTENQVLMKVVEEPLPRMKAFYPYVSDKMQHIVDKATAKNPAMRYQTCEEFAKALRDALAPNKSFLHKVKALPAWVKVAAAVLVAGLMGGGAFYAWDYNRVKVRYYKDYTEQWGMPVGIGQVSEGQHQHMARCYKFVEQRRKVLTVSHVNSLDKLIDDTESERSERPVDQEIIYNSGGKVSKVKVKDRSGKVLYVKGYNDQFTVMQFQQDDEYGTPRTIASNTVGSHNLEENGSRISQWALETDGNGYVTAVNFVSMDGTPIGDENGIYGRKYVRDSKGRITEVHYTGYNRKPQSTRWGLGIKKFEYDDDDNWVKATYLTIDNKPALDKEDGMSVLTLAHDENGNIVMERYLDSDNNPMTPKGRSNAGIKYAYNERGLLTEKTSLDGNQKPAYTLAGYSTIRYEHDDNGYISKATYHDPGGATVFSADGYAGFRNVNDVHGNATEQWCLDTSGNTCTCNEGFAGVKCDFDNVGNLVRKVYYDKNNKPVMLANGQAGAQYEYDKLNQVLTLTYLGTDLKPAANSNNVATVKYGYDQHGNNTSRLFYDPRGKICLSNEGVAGWRDSYNKAGLLQTRTFLGLDGKITTNTRQGYARITYAYDKNGNLLKSRYYDTSGNLTLVDGFAGYNYKRDERGNVLERYKVGTDEQLASGQLRVVYTYDEVGNATSFAVFSNSGKGTNSAGIHRIAYKYNSRNQLVKEEFFNTDGLRTISNVVEAAIVENTYDEKGNKTKIAYFGTNTHPCIGKDGWSSKQFKFDKLNRKSEITTYGTDGKPLELKGYFKQVYTYNDNSSRVAEWLLYDASGQPANCNTGWQRGVYSYDSKGNQQYIQCYDTDGNLTVKFQWNPETESWDEM